MASTLAGRFASCHRIFPSTEGLPSTTRPYGICFKCLPQSRSALTLRSFQPIKKPPGPISTRGFLFRYELEDYAVAPPLPLV